MMILMIIYDHFSVILMILMIILVCIQITWYLCYVTEISLGYPGKICEKNFITHLFFFCHKNTLVS